MNKAWPSVPGPERPVWVLLIPSVIVALVSWNAYSLSLKYGQLDAWVTWNFHARYLTDPVNWPKLFQNIENDHPDYPLCLPATIGLFMRVCSPGFSPVIPFVLALAVAVSIPMLIFTELSPKNFVVASVVAFIFAADRTYAGIGVSQYADTLLAFFFLCAMVCLSRAGDDPRSALLAVLFLGCGAWTKNEGAILALLTLVFYPHIFFSKKNRLYTAIGIIFPVVVLSVFRLTSHVQNDVMSMQNDQTWAYLGEWERYAIIIRYLFSNFRDKFIFLAISFVIYLLACAIYRQLPARGFFLILACMMAYTMIYVITPYPLEWHLATSQDRLIHQLMPAALFLVAGHIAKMPLRFPLRIAKGSATTT